MPLQGTGTVNNPYLINNLDDLREFSEATGPTRAAYWSGFSKLTANIDATTTSTWNSGAGVMPIGNATVFFTGNFNGNGKIISNVTMNRPTEWYQGFFGRLSSAVISKVGVTGYFNLGQYGAAFIGTSDQSTIDQCFIETTSNSVVEAGFINDARVGANVITNCYSAGTATVCGFIDSLFAPGSTQFCYSRTAVTSPTGKGFMRNINGATADNYYDSQVSGKIDSIGATPKTTTQMKTKTTYTGWDSTTVWTIEDGEYPTLQVFEPLAIVKYNPTNVEALDREPVTLTCTISGYFGGGDPTVELVDVTTGQVISTGTKV